MSERTLLSWSGGKDSALTLYHLRQQQRKKQDAPKLQVVGLLTTVTEEYDRISMHGVRRQLLEAQARSLGLSLTVVLLPPDASNKQYEGRMQETLELFQQEGVQSVTFGDIFLGDLRQYREEKLASIGLSARFPLWQQNTTTLAQQFLHDGFEAIVTCVDTQALDASFSGRSLDSSFFADLPPHVDPCGENGEFHSFVHNGPLFAHPIPCSRGDVVLRDQRFAFCDLLPA